MTIQKLRTLEWVKVLLTYTDDIYVVGGYVRDFLLNKKSNDIDLLVTKLDYQAIVTILSKFGKLIETNGHFKTIKFRPYNWTSDLEDIDIVIPRTDVLMSDNEFSEAKLKDPGLTRHHAFKIISDPNMSPVEDLKRRDITINSIAQHIISEELLDPFNGMTDLKRGVIKMTNPSTFKDDPVRMLRSLRFAKRLSFSIDSFTATAISENIRLLSNMSKERFLMELEKTFYSEGILTAYYSQFIKLGFQHVLFGSIAYDTRRINLANISRFSEFLFLIMGYRENSSIFDNFIDSLKGSKQIAKELTIFEKAMPFEDLSKLAYKKFAFKMYSSIGELFTSELFNADLNRVISDMMKGLFIKSIKDISLNGDDLKQILSIDNSNIKEKGFLIGRVQRLMVDYLLKYPSKNNPTALKAFIKRLTL